MEASPTVVVNVDRPPTVAAGDLADDMPVVQARPRDLQRTLQLWLASVWLLDAVLQIQPFMFTPGRNGLSGTIGATAAGNPHWVASTITWNASVVDHHPVLTNSIFAGIQFVIAFGIVSRRTCRPALVLSIVWAIGVWWFGEGLGGLLSGAATPFGGGPGAVLFYATLGLILWPGSGSDAPFVAARTLGRRRAEWIWTGCWGVLALLFLVGSGRQGGALHDLVQDMQSGEPGWLVHIDRFSASFLLLHGPVAAIALAAICCLVAVSVFLPPVYLQAAIVVAVVVFTLNWVMVQDFGGILAGGATDPNSGPLVVLFALTYWPVAHPRTSATRPLLAGTCARSVAPPRRAVYSGAR